MEYHWQDKKINHSIVFIIFTSFTFVYVAFINLKATEIVSTLIANIWK